jgi:hypothetical protein
MAAKMNWVVIDIVKSNEWGLDAEEAFLRGMFAELPFIGAQAKVSS